MSQHGREAKFVQLRFTARQVVGLNQALDLVIANHKDGLSRLYFKDLKRSIALQTKRLERMIPLHGIPTVKDESQDDE